MSTPDTAAVVDPAIATPAAPAATTPPAATPAPVEDTRSPREIVMDQITAMNDARTDAEHVEAGLAPIVAAPPPDTATDESQLAAQLAADKPTVLDKDLDRLVVKRKIDGVETEITVADMLAQHQMDGAARNRLDEATRLVREAKEELARAKAPTIPPVGVAPAPATPDSTAQAQPKVDDPTAVAKAIVGSLMEGDEDKAVAALTKVLAGQQNTNAAPDTKELAAQLAPVLKQQLSADSALEKFSTDYQDIVSDPYLATLADQFLADEAKDTTKSFADQLEAAGKKTRDWLQAKTGKPAAAPTPTMDLTQKLERKSTIDEVKGLNTKAANVEEPVPTPSEVIAQMRAARGLA